MIIVWRVVVSYLQYHQRGYVGGFEAGPPSIDELGGGRVIFLVSPPSFVLYAAAKTIETDGTIKIHEPIGPIIRFDVMGSE